MIKQKLLFAILVLCNFSFFSQNLDWGINFGSIYTDHFYDIEADALGNVIVTGIINGNCDFDASSGTHLITPAGPQGQKNDVFIAKYSPQSTLLWVHHFDCGCTDSPQISSDSIGNIYMCGGFSGNVDFDFGPGVQTLSSGNWYVLKLDPNGNFLWVTGYNYLFINNMTADKSGNVYFTGAFSGTVDFDPGVGTYNLTCMSSTNYDCYLCKLNPNGTLGMALSFPSTHYGSGVDIKTLKSGSILLFGDYSSTIDLDPGSGVQSPSGNFSSFIVKLSPNGSFLNMGFPPSANQPHLEIDPSDNIYLAGTFSGTIDLDPSASVFNVSNPGSADIYYFKMDSNLNFINGYTLANQNNYEQLIEFKFSESGDLYIGGSTTATSFVFDSNASNGTLNFTNSSCTYFIAKYNSSNIFQYAFSPGGFNPMVAPSQQNSFYAAGKGFPSCDIDPSATVTTLPVSNDSIIIVRFGYPFDAISEMGKNTNQIKVFPNPFENSMEYAFPETDNYLIELTDLNGRLIHSEKVKSKSFLYKNESLEKGIYFFRVTNSENKIFTGKVIRN